MKAVKKAVRSRDAELRRRDLKLQQYLDDLAKAQQQPEEVKKKSEDEFSDEKQWKKQWNKRKKR